MDEILGRIVTLEEENRKNVRDMEKEEQIQVGDTWAMVAQRKTKRKDKLGRTVSRERGRLEGQ